MTIKSLLSVLIAVIGFIAYQFDYRISVVCGTALIINVAYEWHKTTRKC